MTSFHVITYFSSSISAFLHPIKRSATLRYSMDLAFSTNAYTRFSLHDALRGIHKAGFRSVEILADVPHAYPGLLDESYALSTRKELDRLELKVSNVNANCTFGYWKHAPAEPYFEPSLISPDENLREDRKSLILKTLDFAKAIGAKNISITSGRCLGGMPPDRAAATFAQNIKPLLDRADQLDLDIGIECEPGLLIEYVSELREWIDRLGHSRLGANLDIGHSQVLGEDLHEAITTLGKSIWNLHVEDIPGRKHYHLIPGEGTLPWHDVRDALHTINYKRGITVELYTHTADPQTAAEKSYEFLSRIFS